MSPGLLGLVAAASAAGGAARYGLSRLIANRTRGTFPIATLLVNLSGALAIGFLYAGMKVWGWTPASVFSLAFLGSYTTVSAFSLETLLLLRERQYPAALGNILFSVGGCLAAAWIGYLIGIWFFSLVAGA